MFMNRHLPVAATLLAAALFSLPVAAQDAPPKGDAPAQDGAKDGQKGGRPGGREGMGRRAGGAQGMMVQHRMFNEALKTVEGSYTADQKQKIDAARTAFDAKAKEFQPKMEELMKKMMEARQSGNADPKAIETLKEEMANLRESAPKPEEFQATVMGVLTADQQTMVKAKMEAMKKEAAEKGGAGKGRGQGGPGGPGGPDGPGGKRRGGGKPPAGEPGDMPPPPPPPADKPVDFPE
jgi:Spy/CpxP family protein refolding chaperone